MKSLPVQFLFTYAVNETSRRMCYYCLSLICCFLVALTTLIVNSLLSQTPIIFLIIAQNDDGEIDMKLTPTVMETKVQYTIQDSSYFNSFINFTEYQHRVSNYGLLFGSSARMEINGSYGTTSNNTNYTGLFYFINTDMEAQMSLGKEYNYSKLSIGQCNIHQSLASSVNLGVGDTIYLEIDVSSYFVNILIANFKSLTNVFNITQISPINVTFPCTISNVMPTIAGKGSNDFKKAAFLEIDYFFSYMANFLPPNLTTRFPDMTGILLSLNPQEYSNTIVTNFPNPRPTTYLSSDYSQILSQSTTQANSLIKAVGKDFNLVLNMPILTSLKQFANGAVFLGLILYLTIFILFLLSVILIYSLNTPWIQ